MENTPFDRSYVLRLTSKHMRSAINTSIRKTFDRVDEFKDDPEKSAEVYSTLDVLHHMNKLIDDFQEHNKHLFNGK
jgi:hypothetical protein